VTQGRLDAIWMLSPHGRGRSSATRCEWRIRRSGLEADSAYQPPFALLPVSYRHRPRRSSAGVRRSRL